MLRQAPHTREFDRLFIGGEFVEPTAGSFIESINPATGDVWESVAMAEAPDVDAAVDAADIAFRQGPWRKMTGVQRARLLEELARLIESQADALAAIDSTDNGKPITLCRADAVNAAYWLRYFAGLADKLHGEYLPVSGNDWAYTVP